MTERPWVKPKEVKDYSEYTQVQNRSTDRLRFDISRAEQYVIAYTNNDFSAYETIPEAVKSAVILLAEYYAYKSSSAIGSDGKATGKKAMKSETFDDYSYTSADESAGVEALDVKVLLDPYIVVEARQGVTLRMRKL